MKISIRCKNMMSFYEMIFTIKVSHLSSRLLNNQCRCRIIPFSEKCFHPCIKTPNSYITDCGSSRAIHANASHYSIKLIDEMKSGLFILQMIIRQFCNDECIFDVFNVRHMNFFAIHKRFSAFPSIKTFIPANLINDA